MKSLPHRETSVERPARRTIHSDRLTRVSFCHFQAIDYDVAGSGNVRKSRERSATLRAFREVSARYFREEAPPHSWTEVLLFLFISSIAAWPILVALSLMFALAPS